MILVNDIGSVGFVSRRQSRSADRRRRNAKNSSNVRVSLVSSSCNSLTVIAVISWRSFPGITSNDLAQAVAEGLDEVEEQWKHQRDLDARGLKVRRGSTAHKQAMMVRSPDPKILQRALAGQQVLKVAEKLRAR